MNDSYMHSKRYRLRQLRGEKAYVDATPIRLHLATLFAAGWSLNSVSGVSGVPATTLSKISTGQQGNVRAATIAKVLAVEPDALADRTNRDGREPFVSRVGTVRRIQALMYLGWTHEAMRAHSGYRTSVLVHQQGRWVTRSTHDGIAAMYRELCARTGPSKATASRAKKAGYVGPLAWHNIDRDPAPYADLDDELEDDYLDEAAIQRRMNGERRIRLTPTETFELVRRWAASGRPLNECERVTGINPHRHLERTAS